MALLRALPCLLACLLACLPTAALAIEHFTVKVVDKKPQPRENFVQGLQIVNGHLYVSTGNYGESRLLRYHFESGKLETQRKLHPRIFGEGVTVFGDRVYQLTWRERLLLIYRKSDLEFLQRITIPGEGWGITNNGVELVYSDGSDRLHFMSPKTGKIRRSLQVTEHGRPVKLLNELEWIDGSVWANIWHANRIVVIDPSNGEVTASIDLQGLLPAQERRSDTDVLNGIARDPADGALWVTGKRWPWLYRVELVPSNNVSKAGQGGADSR